VELCNAWEEYLNESLVNLTSKRIQCDEIWRFVGARQRNVTPELLERNPDAGDVWTWVAIDADTELACSWAVGKRDWTTAWTFVKDLESRVANRVQLTTDGNKLYFHAICGAFHEDVDYAVLMKLYGGVPVLRRKPPPHASRMQWMRKDCEDRRTG
jgi:hypothetical protein